ncbi:hypothetical protein B2G71_22010 [Novosphingobium sp. PC22D]|uniref:GumC family protein n=1 Tax=Novosphingobium sp. PC22D TaxID=1962403 RepID=UPI000BEFDB4F|nr:hypothetical protein [Novosphingobium sp. PC22D]PEQ10504.1 hypothetical protein B2G71_22010 [Novosphingobium sp. PC22D]
MMLAPPEQRRLMRLWAVVRDGLPSAHRYRRYVMAVGSSLLLVWALTVAYLVVAPVRYTSMTTLILPGSGVGGSLNLDSVGQASSVTASAFSSSTLSPTENYKRLLMADITRRRAASLVGEEPGSFPKPSIKLLDQTNLIEISLSGASAEQARERSEALRDAFLTILVGLRKDEAQKREAADRKRIVELEKKVQDTQRRLLDFQGRTGLVSLDQFDSRIGVIDKLEDRERDARTTQAQRSAVRARLGSVLQIGPDGVRKALLLKADPVFRELLDRYAQRATDATEAGGTLGESHITRAELDAETGALRDALIARGRSVSGLSAAALNRFADMSVSDGRERMFEALIGEEGASAGAQAALAEIRGQINEQNARSTELVAQASELADLTREHRVAEAVFSSALARLDTNKADPFASYPLVQTFEEPSLPSERSSPSVPLALAGAFVASLLILIGFALTWLRQPILRKLLPSA